MKYYLFTCQGNRDVGGNVYTADCPNHSPLDLVSIFRCPSSPRNPTYSRRVEQRSVCKGCGSWVVEEADQWLVGLFIVNAQQNKKKSTKKKMTNKKKLHFRVRATGENDWYWKTSHIPNACKEEANDTLNATPFSFSIFRLNSRLSFDSQRIH